MGRRLGYEYGLASEENLWVPKIGVLKRLQVGFVDRYSRGLQDGVSTDTKGRTVTVHTGECTKVIVVEARDRMTEATTRTKVNLTYYDPLLSSLPTYVMATRETFTPDGDGESRTETTYNAEPGSQNTLNLAAVIDTLRIAHQLKTSAT